jgi:ABC-type sugar transport system ATPase subunit
VADRLRAPAIALSGIEKQYPGVRALDGVSVAFAAGRVHALVGENGAGKSTLIRVLSGAERPDAGEIRIEGRQVAFHGPDAALRAGIAAIHQEPTRIPERSVAENLFVEREPRGWLGIDRRRMEDLARAALARVGLDLHVRRALGSFPPSVQQKVAIARALDLEARVLVLDEPTASLDRPDAEGLLAIARELAARGLAVVFVGHRLDEILAIADEITVLRGGRKVAELARGAATKVGLVEAMLGRSVEREELRRRGSSETPTALRAEGLRGPGLAEPIDLAIARGEILGLAGLLGSGRTEILRLLAGVERRTGGDVRLGGETVPAGDVRAAVDRGLVLSPEERQAEGVFPNLSVRENVTIAAARAFGRASRAEQRALAAELAARLRIACADLEQPVGTLSGGNQQKALLARWLAISPKALLLDEPTRGVDVGAKAEILAAVRELAEKGASVALTSSALDEVLETADRIVSLHDRRLVAEHRGDAIAEADVIRAIAGGAA